MTPPQRRVEPHCYRCVRGEVHPWHDDGSPVVPETEEEVEMFEKLQTIFKEIDGVDGA